MAGTRLDAIRSVYENWRYGDFRAGVEFFDGATTFILRPEFPDAGIYVGPDALSRYMRTFLEPWERLTITPVDLSEVGDTIVAEVQQQGAGRLSGADTGFRYFQLWTFRGQTVVRLENVMTREEVEAALGHS